MKVVAALTLLLCLFVHAQPNVLFVVSEDNSDHLGCYGDKSVHTPALDKLAAEGVRYTRAYVPYSVCSPSRAIFLTGLYTRQTGHIGLATHKFSMYKDFKTMPAYFQEAGYYTGFLGKTHVNPERVVEDYVDHRAIRNSNFGKTISIKTYADEARKVMDQAREQKKSFLLIINYADAHRRFINTSKNGYPTKLETDEIEPYPWIGSDSPELRKQITAYRNCMNRLDEGVDMVLKHLDELKERDNTLIVYVSDHGADFPRGKASIYENGVRIPMIVRYPKSFPKGKVENSLVSTVDILPTMLREAGMTVPRQLPGLALQDVDAGKAKREYVHTFGTGSAPPIHYLQFGIRDERYKLIWNPYRTTNLLAVSRYKYIKDLPEKQWRECFVTPPEYQLYDLQEDPHEWNNLAEMPEHRSTKDRLIAAMRAFQKEIKDPFFDKGNLDALEKEQLAHQKINYKKKKGFRWPHLKMFEEAQRAVGSSHLPAGK